MKPLDGTRSSVGVRGVLGCLAVLVLAVACVGPDTVPAPGTQPAAAGSDPDVTPEPTLAQPAVAPMPTPTPSPTDTGVSKENAAQPEIDVAPLGCGCEAAAVRGRVVRWGVRRRTVQALPRPGRARFRAVHVLPLRAVPAAGRSAQRVRPTAEGPRELVHRVHGRGRHPGADPQPDDRVRARARDRHARPRPLLRRRRRRRLGSQTTGAAS